MVLDRITLAKNIDDFCKSFEIPIPLLEPADIIFVFGRNDESVARTAARVYDRTLAGFVFVSGGVGKDSGILPTLGLSEAGYLIALMLQAGVPGKKMFGEFDAKNGAENCQFGLELMRSKAQVDESCSIILVAHWASLYRLSCQMQMHSRRLGFCANCQLVATPRPETLSDDAAAELIAEFRRLMDWPAKGWLDPIELPPELVNAVEAL